MSLRARLALIVAVVLTVVILIVGAIVVREARQTLIKQVDEQVKSTAIKIKPKYADPLVEPGYDIDDEDSGSTAATPASVAEDYSEDDGDSPHYRGVARFVYSPDGMEIMSDPSGFSDNPKSPPEIPDIPSQQLYSNINAIQTVPSENGALNYRMMVQVDERDNFVFTAAPLDDAEAAVDGLIRTMAISGIAGILIAGLASWAMISREFRPVDRMISTAAKIGEGDLSQRVPQQGEETELGRLSRALNRMLERIQESADVKTRSEARLRQFVADAAHELRTPLTSVRGYAELFRQGALDSPERLNQAMRRIEGEGTRMGRLLDEMLLLARLDQQVEHIQEPVNLSNIVHDSVDAFRTVQPERTVVQDIASDVQVRGVETHLRQVIDNLLTNARIHTPADANVAVTLKQHEQTVELRVEDEGPGIDQNFQLQIFERFTREDPARTRSTGGSGLGLAIVASLVEAHGGTIRVDSEPGDGATFTVLLPAFARDS